MSHKNVEIYTKTHCPFCAKAKELLQRKSIQFVEHVITEQAQQDQMALRTGGPRTVPQIFVDGVFLAGGCDGLYIREQSGELDQILGLV